MRTGQIIPMWIQPHEEVYINDNTFYEEETSENGGPTFICPFIGGKGRDTMLTFNRWSDFIAEYGYPNFRLWGQPMYMPYVLLYSGNAKCHCIRLTAEDAAYANNIITVGYKAADGKLVLKFKVYSRTNIRQISDIEVYANTLERINPDEDGFKWVPIMSFWALGKGTYGNDFRIRITHDKNADKENDYKNYNVDLVSTEQGASTLESYNVTFDVDAKDPLTKVTNYIEDVVNDVKGDGSKRFGCQFFYNNYLTLFEEYTKVYEAGGVVPPNVIQVDRLPAQSAPRTDALYHLTQDDGSFVTGTMVKYDGVSGTFNNSGYSVLEVTALPAVATASATIIYRLTADYNDGTTTYTAGDYIVSSGAYITGPTIIDVDRLPNTVVVNTEDGNVYELTADDGNKAAGTQWIFSAVAGEFIEYVPDSSTNPEPIPYTISTWDMFGYNRFTKEDDPYIELDEDGDLSIMDIEGTPLVSGDDGIFATDGSVPASEREAAMDQAYVNVFQGAVDKKILSTRRYPAEFILDAGWSINVKKAIAALVTQRMDAVARLDCGLLTSVNDLYDMGLALGSINTYMVSKNAHMFRTLDPVTGRNIPVTITLWLASQIPLHYQNYGNHVPMAGENYAVLSGYVEDSIRPVIDADDLEIKEKLLREYQINYVEALDEDTYIRGTQNTSQVEDSDLSEENNVLVLMEIKRKIERLAAKRRYRWAEEEDLRMFKDSANEIFSSYRGTKCRSLDIEVKSSKWEKTRYIVHVYLAVVFRTFQKRAIIEIDVNPRT